MSGRNTLLQVDRSRLLQSLSGALHASASGATGPDTWRESAAVYSELAAMAVADMDVTDRAGQGDDGEISLIQHYRDRLAARMSARPIRDDTPAGLAVPDEGLLTAYLGARFPDRQVQARAVRLAAGGWSKQTLFFDIVDGTGVEQLVLRRDSATVDIGTSVTVEFEILRALHDAGAPVAEPLWMEEKSALLPGGPFMVSRRVAGAVAGNVMGPHSGLDYDPVPSLAHALCRIHAMPLSDLPGTIDKRFDASVVLDRLRFWEDKYRAAQGAHPSPSLLAGFTWLKDHVELGARHTGIVHGDFGFHNILYDRGAVSAVLDWELCQVGSPAEDLAYLLPALGNSGWSRSAFIDAYASHGGSVISAQEILYYEMFRNVRNAVISAGSISGFNRGAHDSPLLAMHGARHYSEFVLATALLLATQEDRSLAVQTD